MSKKIICSIAATDNSGHAGLLNDLRVFSDLGLQGTSVVTGITAQNSTDVLQTEAIMPELLKSQWQALITDLTLSAVKVGVVFNSQQLVCIKQFLTKNKAAVVWDPVRSSSVGDLLSNHNADEMRAVMIEFLSVCTVFTPNIPEAEWLLQRNLDTAIAIEQAAIDFAKMGAKSVLIKGGHFDETSTRCEDYFYSDTHKFWLSQQRLTTNNTRGTGCMLSSAIASFLLHGKSTADAVVLANAYVHQGMIKGFQIGKGHGLLANTGWPEQFAYFPTVADKSGFREPKSYNACSPQHRGLYPVVDTVEWLEKLLKVGVRTLQIRIKKQTGSELESSIVQSIALGKKYNAQLYINDYWQLAIQHNAYGVHLGQEDLDTANLERIRHAGLRLGISTHSEYEWARAAAFKPSYIALGSVFPTQTKPVEVIGLENLRQWVKILKSEYPLTAIGGITLNNLDDVLATGVESVAVVSAVTKAKSYHAACQDFKARLSNIIDSEK